MTVAADYTQFSDARFDLSKQTDIDKMLTHNIAAVPASGEGAILTWNVRRAGAGNVSYQVKVNGVVLAPYTVTSGDWSAVQEAMGTSSIHQGNNTVEFVVTAGTGVLSIGDVILWYRKNV